MSDEPVKRLKEVHSKFTVPLVKEAGITALAALQALRDTRDEQRGQRELAIAFTDLVGFSSWALDAGDDAALDLLREIKRIEDPIVRANGGTVVKRLGDGTMAVFDDAPGAFDALLAIDEEISALEVDGIDPRIRAGLHVGCPRRVSGGDYLGVDVNVAARIAENAKPRQLLVSGPALEHLDADRLGARKRRRFRGKGVPKEFEVYAVELGR